MFNGSLEGYERTETAHNVVCAERKRKEYKEEAFRLKPKQRKITRVDNKRRSERKEAENREK